jgi:hypothetical protein
LPETLRALGHVAVERAQDRIDQLVRVAGGELRIPGVADEEERVGGVGVVRALDRFDGRARGGYGRCRTCEQSGREACAQPRRGV